MPPHQATLPNVDWGEKKSATHVPELDGLRAVAIGLVMIFHFTSVHFDGQFARIVFSVTRGGWIGVDLFFVLSGFLITGICLDEQGPGFFRAFYGRRALRILPAYFLALAVITGVLLLATGRTPAGLAWMAVFATNIVSAHANSLTAVPSIAQHLWSVSVEEQFYLVWPICVTFLPRRLALAFALLAIPIAGILRGWFIAEGAPIAAHELTVARMDALATGAVLAFVFRSRLWPGISRRAAAIANAAPLALWLIVGLAICGAASSPVMSSTTKGAHVAAVLRYSVLCVIGAAAVTVSASTRGDGPLARALTRKSVQWLGRRSYGMYLFHPVAGALSGLAFVPQSAVGLAGFMLTATAITCVLAEFSWRTIEVPALSLKRFFPYGVRQRLREPEGFDGGREKTVSLELE